MADSTNNENGDEATMGLSSDDDHATFDHESDEDAIPTEIRHELKWGVIDDLKSAGYGVDVSDAFFEYLVDQRYWQYSHDPWVTFPYQFTGPEIDKSNPSKAYATALQCRLSHELLNAMVANGPEQDPEPLELAVDLGKAILGVFEQEKLREYQHCHGKEEQGHQGKDDHEKCLAERRDLEERLAASEQENARLLEEIRALKRGP